MEALQFLSTAVLKPNLINRIVQLKDVLLKMHKDDDTKEIVYEKYPELKYLIEDILSILDIDLDE